MTTSFIEDTSNPASNPFNGPTPKQQQEQPLLNQSGDDNDLNKTHQLSDDGDHEIEDGEIVEQINPAKAMTHFADADALANVLGSLNIVGNSSEQADPSTWQMLNLPKPVNPNDSVPPASASSSSASASASASSSLTDKKATPNGKKPVVVESPKAETKSVTRNQSSSSLKPAVKASVPHPVYLEVSYVPAHGHAQYCDVEFFRRVRARHFVFSSEEVSESVLNALLDAKETWEDKSVPVSLVLTYESEAAQRWYVANQERLLRLKVDVMPAANMGTVTLDDNPDMSCRALKIEL